MKYIARSKPEDIGKLNFVGGYIFKNIYSNSVDGNKKDLFYIDRVLKPNYRPLPLTNIYYRTLILVNIHRNLELPFIILRISFI